MRPTEHVETGRNGNIPLSGLHSEAAPQKLVDSKLRWAPGLRRRRSTAAHWMKVPFA